MGIDPFSIKLVAPSEIETLLREDSSIAESLRRITSLGHTGFLVDWHEFQNPQAKGWTLRVVEETDPTLSDIVMEIFDAGFVVQSIRKLHPPEVAQILQTQIGKQEI